MKLNQIKINSEDISRLNNLKMIYEDIFVLGHEEHYTDLGEQLDYFENKYGKKIVRQIEKSEEISSMIDF